MTVRSARATLALVIAAALALVTGCSALDGSSGVDPAGTPRPEGLERPELRVGVLPIVDVAVLRRAVDAGYFAAEGLTVRTVPVQGGAVALPQLVSGDLDMTWTNWTSLFQAQAQGIGEFRVLEPGYVAGPASMQILAPRNGAVRTGRDLAGKRVAVNTFGNVTELVVRSAVDAVGVDPASVRFVALGFPDMVPALESGRVDAALLVEPFLGQAVRSAGAVRVLDAVSGPTRGLATAGTASTARFARENPRTVAAFQRALERARLDMADPRTLAATLSSYTSIPEAAVPGLAVGRWPARLEPGQLQRAADLQGRYGMLTRPVDVAPMLATSGG